MLAHKILRKAAVITEMGVTPISLAVRVAALEAPRGKKAAFAVLLDMEVPLYAPLPMEERFRLLRRAAAKAESVENFCREKLPACPIRVFYIGEEEE